MQSGYYPNWVRGGHIMLQLNRNEYMDKLHACWIGKNVGGTMGAPFEGSRAVMNVTGYTHESNEPLPNDDLDLQLVWLCAMEDVGAKSFNINTLADYWLDWIPPHWNEYGICKTNLRMGLLPPLSGEMDNEKWKHSNGAWIRSEIWAALAPGRPEIAVKYAIMDAMYDHGCGEGVYAEIFTAGMQSMAYLESDIHKLIDSALARIPADSMTAKTIRLVIDCHNSGVPYLEARERVVEFNKELGWFQVPGNIGFTIIGLLYGEGDYKKSLCYAINCGDDTDCTAATVGATLGIIGGTSGIPDELKKRIGDRIITVSINGMYSGRIPKTCTELTSRTAALVPSVMQANGIDFGFTDGETVNDEEPESIWRVPEIKFLLERSPYSCDITNYTAFNTRVEFDELPRISSGESRRVKLKFFCNSNGVESRKLQFRLLLPDGWTCEKYARTLSLLYRQPPHGLFGTAETEFTVIAGENIDAINRLYMEVTCPTMAYPVLVPIIFIG